MDVLLGLGAEMSSGVRYRMRQEVKRRRDNTIQKRKEYEQQLHELEERNRQNEVEVVIKDRLEKMKVPDL